MRKINTLYWLTVVLGIMAVGVILNEVQNVVRFGQIASITELVTLPCLFLGIGYWLWRSIIKERRG